MAVPELRPHKFDIDFNNGTKMYLLDGSTAQTLWIILSTPMSDTASFSHVLDL